MIIRSVVAGPSTQSSSAPSPAWKAVEQIQKQDSSEYLLVTQPDHAHISATIASAFDRARFPLITSEVVEAIRLHDEGWAAFEGTSQAPREPLQTERGKPLTFLDAGPEMFLKAWMGSIAAAAQTGPTGQYLVSGHFRALAEHRLNSVFDPPETAERLTDFAAREAERQCDLLPKTGRSGEELKRLLAALQFCDLISLAICSGVSILVEFSIDFGLGPIRMNRDGDRFSLAPCPLEKSVTLRIPELQFGAEPLRARMVQVNLSC